MRVARGPGIIAALHSLYWSAPAAFGAASDQ
jgi:hypothetical protein